MRFTDFLCQVSEDDDGLLAYLVNEGIDAAFPDEVQGILIEDENLSEAEQVSLLVELSDWSNEWEDTEGEDE